MAKVFFSPFNSWAYYLASVNLTEQFKNPKSADFMTKPAHVFTPDWISAPGETIADLLDEKGWTQSELASRAGYTTKHVSLLINGKASITEETALKLERVLGSTARFWLTREANYREALARTKEG
jgi:HTH-type transcriptional regulator/antitoxin HigA